jgi:hypothetical protein
VVSSVALKPGEDGDGDLGPSCPPSDVRIAADRIVGSGLMLDEEALQLSLFTTDGSGRRTRVERPSRGR